MLKESDPKQRPISDVPGEDTPPTDPGMTGGGNQGEHDGHPVLDMPESLPTTKSEIERDVDEDFDTPDPLDPRRFAEHEPVESKDEVA